MLHTTIRCDLTGAEITRFFPVSVPNRDLHFREDVGSLLEALFNAETLQGWDERVEVRGVAMDWITDPKSSKNRSVRLRVTYHNGSELKTIEQTIDLGPIQANAEPGNPVI